MATSFNEQKFDERMSAENLNIGANMEQVSGD